MTLKTRGILGALLLGLACLPGVIGRSFTVYPTPQKPNRFSEAVRSGSRDTAVLVPPLFQLIWRVHLRGRLALRASRKEF